MKYLTPYKEVVAGEYPFFSRYRIDKNVCHNYWIQRKKSNGLWLHVYKVYDFNTKEEAMQDLDNNLIEKGYILLTQEQVDKLLSLI